MGSRESPWFVETLWRRVVVPGRRYTGTMTRTLTAAIAKLETLTPDEQDRVATWLLDELKDEEHWAQQFAASQDVLAGLAAEALADHAAGRTTELDPEKL